MVNNQTFSVLSHADWTDPDDRCGLNWTANSPGWGWPINCQCNATSNAEPDIAGPGIIITFLLSSWLTWGFGYAVTYFEFFQIDHKPEIQQTTDPVAKLEKFIKEHRLAVLLAEKVKKLRGWFKEKSGAFMPRIGADKPPILVGRDKRSRPHDICRRLFDALVDLQCLTGMAIIVAALPQDDLSYYHRYMVNEYSQLIVQSMWVYEMFKPLRRTSWSSADAPRKVRDVLRFSTYLLSFVYFTQWMFDRDTYDILEEGRCFLVGDNWIATISKEGPAVVISYVMTSITAVASFATTFWGIDGLQRLGRILSEYGWNIRRRITIDPPEHSSIHWQTTSFVLEGMTLVTLVIWDIMLSGIKGILALTGFFRASPLPLLVFLSFYSYSCSYVIIDAHEANRALISGDESIWSFGQVFALVSLFAVILSVVDSFANSAEGDQDKSQDLDQNHNQGQSHEHDQNQDDDQSHYRYTRVATI